jgi:hypothetical protein
VKLCQASSNRTATNMEFGQWNGTSILTVNKWKTSSVGNIRRIQAASVCVCVCLQWNSIPFTGIIFLSTTFKISIVNIWSPFSDLPPSCCPHRFGGHATMSDVKSKRVPGPPEPPPAHSASLTSGRNLINTIFKHFSVMSEISRSWKSATLTLS